MPLSLDDWKRLFDRIPVEEHPKLVLMLHNNQEISLDSLIRYDPEYLILRGRLSGTTDEGRVFFVPYDELMVVRIERLIIEREYVYLLDGGEKPAANAGALQAPGDKVERTEKADPAKPAASAPTAGGATAPMPLGASDPAVIAKNNLLAKIRAARGGNPPAGNPPAGNPPPS